MSSFLLDHLLLIDRASKCYRFERQEAMRAQHIRTNCNTVYHPTRER